MRSLLLVLAVLVAGCAEEGAAPTPGGQTASPVATPSPALTPTPSVAPVATPSAPAPHGPEEGQVAIVGFEFVNAETYVPAGTAVLWYNQDPVSHTATADDGSFDSGTIRSEYGFEHVFGTPGRYPYHCEIHPTMTGAIVVLGDVVVPLTPEPTPSEPTSPTSPSPSPTPTPTPTPASAPAATLVDIHNFRFLPGAITVPVGTTVQWKDHDSAPHTATSDTGAFDTGTISSGGTAQRTFATAGTFPYHCAIHPSMTGTVTVTG